MGWQYSGPARRREGPLPPPEWLPDPLPFGALDEVLPWRHKFVRLWRYLTRR